ncbi:MAG: hypothetical protein IH806_06025 [Proteobacteria bacterium]|nr:hypothetical protein [Pseudomonadota bacterium]
MALAEHDENHRDDEERTRFPEEERADEQKRNKVGPQSCREVRKDAKGAHSGGDEGKLGVGNRHRDDGNRQGPGHGHRAHDAAAPAELELAVDGIERQFQLRQPELDELLDLALEGQACQLPARVHAGDDADGHPYVDGLRHLLGQPEFDDSRRAREAVEVIEDETVLRELLTEEPAPGGTGARLPAVSSYRR